MNPTVETKAYVVPPLVRYVIPALRSALGHLARLSSKTVGHVECGDAGQERYLLLVAVGSRLGEFCKGGSR